jgi:hypothetical protein
MDVTKLSKSDINTKCIGWLRDYSADMSTLQTARERALKAYMCQPYGNEVEGRSQVVMSDVFNTIESILPSLMRIFAGSVDVVQVSGQGPEDDEKAQLMSELLNYQSRKCFNSFIVFYDWFKDALMYKMGVVKYYWKTETTYKNKEFKGLTIDELNVYLSRPDFEVEKQEEIDGLFNIKGKIKTETSKPTVEVLPPEEFIFNVRDKDLRTCFHKKKVHKSTLKKYGITDADVADAVTEMSGENLENERFRDLGGKNFLVDDVDENFVYIYEAYYDEYENGEPVPIKAVIMGNRVIDTEENKYGRPPFRDLSAIRLTHRAVGRSFYDLAGEVQKLKTALVRYILDNIYYQNNAQKIVNPYKINMDDLFDQNVPGGSIRTLDINTPISDAVMYAPVAPLPPQVFGFLEYADGSILENRTGVTRYNQGLDSDSLNKTARGISQIMSASQQRIELIARLFAETGVKGLYQDLAQMNLDFMDKPTAIKINDKWRVINPEDIEGLYDINIDVGIGTGTKEMVVQQLMTMLDIYLKGLVGTGVITPENITELVKAIWENMGFKNADKFVNSEEGKPKASEPDPLQQEMAMLEIQLKRHQIIETQTRGMLNIANAEKAEVGQQVELYKAQYDLLTRGTNVNDGLIPQEAGGIDQTGGAISGGPIDSGLPINAGVLPEGGGEYPPGMAGFAG